MSESITLTIPAKPHMLLVARMALVGFANQCGADVETLDDVRTLSDECCYCLMNQAHMAGELSVKATKEGLKLHVLFEAKYVDASCRNEPPYDLEIARGILSTLATQVDLMQEHGRLCAIRVAVHIGPV